MNKIAFTLFIVMSTFGFSQSSHSLSPYGDIPILGYVYPSMNCNTLNALLRPDFVSNPSTFGGDNLGCGRIPPTGLGFSDQPFVRLEYWGQGYAYELDVKVDVMFEDGFITLVSIYPRYEENASIFYEYFYTAIIRNLGQPVCTYLNEGSDTDISIWYGVSYHLIGISKPRNDEDRRFTMVGLTTNHPFLAKCLDSRDY